MKKIIGLMSLLAPLAFANAAGTNAGATGASTTTAGELGDSQIAQILLTINEGEINAADIAEDEAQHKDVKEFAKMMEEQHKKNMKETRDLAGKLKTDPKDSDLSKTLQTDAKTSNKTLKEKEDAAFDAAYIAQQISMHEKALATIRDTLVPAAQSPEMKNHLKKTSGDVAMHLEHAKKIKSNLK